MYYLSENLNYKNTRNLFKKGKSTQSWSFNSYRQQIAPIHLYSMHISDLTDTKQVLDRLMVCSLKSYILDNKFTQQELTCSKPPYF